MTPATTGTDGFFVSILERRTGQSILQSDGTV
jgi:hypothetical protein